MNDASTAKTLTQYGKLTGILSISIKETEYDQRHGGPYDRGGADSYYGRPAVPHYFEGATYQSKEVTELTDEEVAAYMAGYEDNELHGDKKQW